MNVDTVNTELLREDPNFASVLLKYRDYQSLPICFDTDFGLSKLPEESGVILIRGARQYGKSTWLERQVVETIRTHGSGSALYLNCDQLIDRLELLERIKELSTIFSKTASVKRLFIDEITTIRDWEKTIKYCVDSGYLEGILVITTGSKATDLRRGAERLPGRKGRLSRNTYIITPIAFPEFKRKCSNIFDPKDLLPAYIISGGSPLACLELATQKMIPDFLVMLMRDWIYGECSASGRERSSLLAILEELLHCGGTAVGYTRLARDTGLANNTVVSGYINLLADLMAVAPCFSWDQEHKVILRRKPCKFHFTNTLVATSFSRFQIRSVSDFRKLPEPEQAKWLEWIVAQELCRRSAIKGDEFPELLKFWSDKESEVDFVVSPMTWIEVKRGQASPFEFTRLAKLFPKLILKVICTNQISTQNAISISMEEFLCECD